MSTEKKQKDVYTLTTMKAKVKKIESLSNDEKLKLKNSIDEDFINWFLDTYVKDEEKLIEFYNYSETTDKGKTKSILKTTAKGKESLSVSFAKKHLIEQYIPELKSIRKTKTKEEKNQERYGRYKRK